MSPFKAIFGRDPPFVIPYECNSKDPVSVQDSLITRDALLQQLKSNLLRAQNYMKQNANKKRRDCQLEIGDLALVKLQPYRQHSVALRKNQKLRTKYFGPFEVVDRIGIVAYKLKMPETAHIHPIFHIFVLKKFVGSSNQPYLPLPLTVGESGPMIQPIAVLDSRVLLRDSSQVDQVLIQWEIAGPEEATWEDVTWVKASYPHFNLEDKVVYKGEGNVTCGKQEKKGHVVDDPHVGVRKSTRARRENIRLREYSF